MLVMSSMKFYLFLKHGNGTWPRTIKLKMLQIKLIIEVISIIGAFIFMSYTFMILFVASMSSHITMPQIIRTLANAPKTSARWYPKELPYVASFWPIHIENMLIMKPPTSEHMWAASVKIASDPEKTPPRISAIIKNIQMIITHLSLLKAVLPFFNFS